MKFIFKMMLPTVIASVAKRIKPVWLAVDFFKEMTRLYTQN